MKSDKLKKSIAIIAAAVAAAALYAYLYCIDASVRDSDVKRPDVNGTERVLSVNVSAQDGTDFDMDITIEPRQYSEDEVEQAFDEALAMLDKEMLGDNESADCVSKKLNFSDSVTGFPFSVQWVFEDYDTVNYDGSLNNIGFDEDEKKDVIVRCILKYEGWVCEKQYTLTVVAPDMSDSEIKTQWLKQKIEESVSGNLSGEYAALPENVAGEELTYTKSVEWSSVFVIILLGVAAAVVVNIGEKKKIEDEAKKRTKELKRDYSEMIHKLALLMGAGMTVRMAWEHIVNEYKLRLESGKTKKRYVYEEMSYTLYQLGSGISEINAYGEFGARCDTKEYLKFSSLIVQNLKKGSRELVNLLELEAIDAFEERKNMAKKYGEEAGTKMLFPMVMMLVVVMGIIMFPALISFSA